MAETNQELQAKLEELDHELEEGDITQKGLVLSVRIHTHNCCRCRCHCHCRCRCRIRISPHVR
jgi:hypothetical protein